MAGTEYQEGELMLVCAKCDSAMIVTDYETIPGMAGRHPYQKCFKCGSRNITGKEETVVTEKDCEKLGITKEQYKANKKYKTESAETVAARIKAAKPAEHETKRPEPETKAPKAATVTIEPGETKTLVLAGTRPVMLPVELYEKIEALAVEEFRPLDMQVQYLIHKGLRS